MKHYTSKDILSKEDLYELQGSFSSSGIPFTYQLTEGEIGWAKMIKGRYGIAEWVYENSDGEFLLTFDDPLGLTEALEQDDMHPKAVMLSDDTALQKLFFWLS